MATRSRLVRMISAAEPLNVDGPKKNDQPSGKSTRWANVPNRQASTQPHSHSLPLLLGLVVSAPLSVFTATRFRSMAGGMISKCIPHL